MDGRDPDGGSQLLAELIDRHGGALLSDLWHYYRIDLRDLLSDEPPLSPRLMLALVLELPHDGAFWASRMGGPQYRGWDEKQRALADLYDAIQAGNHLFLLANRDPNKPKPSLPTPYPRPSDKGAKTEQHKPGSFAAMLIQAKKAARERKEREESGS